MKTTTTNKPDHAALNGRVRCQLDYYTDLSEFLADVTHAKVAAVQDRVCGKCLSTVETKWAGGLTYAAAHAQATSGQAFTGAMFDLRDRISSRVRVARRQAAYLDVTGGSDFDMGGVIAGIPESVFNYDEELGRTRKTLALFCNFGALSDVSEEWMKLRGATYMALVDALESSARYKCSVYLVFGNSARTGNFRPAHHQLVIRLKDCGEKYDPQALGFALCRPEMFRQLTFGYYDLMPNNAEHGVNYSGYGQVGSLSVRGLAEAVGETEDCIDLTTPATGDNLPFRNEPGAIAWVEKQLAKYEVLGN